MYLQFIHRFSKYSNLIVYWYFQIWFSLFVIDYPYISLLLIEAEKPWVWESRCFILSYFYSRKTWCQEINILYAMYIFYFRITIWLSKNLFFFYRPPNTESVNLLGVLQYLLKGRLPKIQSLKKYTHGHKDGILSIRISWKLFPNAKVQLINLILLIIVYYIHGLNNFKSLRYK